MKGLYNYKVSVVSVYDGDTMTVDIDLGFNMVQRKRTIRLYGIDTPEVRGEEREEGLKVRDFVRKVVADASEIYIVSHRDKSGKYGRVLATVILVDEHGNEIDLNQWLLDNNMAEPYAK